MTYFHDPGEPPAPQVEYERALTAWILARGDDIGPARERLDAARAAVQRGQS